MNILITGSTGFVGINLSAYLKKCEHSVFPLNLRDKDWKLSVPKNIDVIIHLAGKAHDTNNTSSIDEYYQVNRDLTIDLYKIFLESEIRNFFYFSSVKAAADQLNESLTEAFPENPKTHYGKSKLEAEQFILSNKSSNGQRTFIIRPCMIHGPGNKGNLNLLFNVVRKGIPWPLAKFENRRSFLSIDNLSYLIEKMLSSPNVSSGIYNFADDEPVSTNQLVQIISEVLGKKYKLLNIPVSFITNFAKIGDFLPIPLNSERLKKLTESYVVSNQKIKTELLLSKLPINSIDGLKKTIKSFE